QVRSDEQQREQPDDGRDQEDRDGPAEDDEDRVGPAAALGRRREERDVAVRVGRDETVEADEPEDRGDDDRPYREAVPRGVRPAPEEAEAAGDPGDEPDLDRDDEERRGVRRLER